MRAWVVGIMAAALCAAAHAAPAEPPADAVRVGPFWLGMSVDQAQAAAPQAAWRIGQRAPSGVALSATAPAALPFAGQTAEIDVLIARYRRALEWRADITTEDAAACLSAGRAWIAATAAAAGPLIASNADKIAEPMRVTATTQTIDGQRVVIPSFNGGGTTVFGAPVQISDKAAALLDARRGANLWPENRWARRQPERFALRSQSPPDAAGPSAEARVVFTAAERRCALSAGVTQILPAPPPERFEATAANTLAGPSLALRHSLISGLATPPIAPLSATFDCAVKRLSGETLGCQPAADAALPQAERAVLQSLAMQNRYQLGAIDRDDPAPMTTRITVTLRPEDALPLDFLSAAPVDSKLIRRVRAPNANALWRNYPSRALERGQEGLIVLTCKVLADHSVLCVNPVGRTPDETTVFAAAALRIAGASIQVDPALTDGRPSAGLVFQQQIMFALAE